MSKYKFLIDAGHGGIDPKTGSYTTDPKIGKSWDHGDFIIYEGVTNRAIAKLVYNKLAALDIDHAVLYDEVFDTTLGNRCTLANRIVAKNPGQKCVFLSIHSNAGKGKGVEWWTSPGQDDSDVLVPYFAKTFSLAFPNMPIRSDKTDGDLDKEAKFYVVMPINNKAHARVLFENFFFDNREEALILLSSEGQEKIADYIVAAIVLIENEQPI